MMGWKCSSNSGKNFMPNYDEKAYCIQNLWLETHTHIYIFIYETNNLGYLGVHRRILILKKLDGRVLSALNWLRIWMSCGLL
jgi:hypothetical protein